jgi:hypothetical protein
MSARTLRAIAAIATASFAISTAAIADTSIATRWKPLGEAQNDCMAHAQMAIFRAGFDAANPGSQSMNGTHGDYTAAIRCLADQRIVLFITAGPSSEGASRYLEVLFGHF